MIELDLCYIRNWSLLLDVKILGTYSLRRHSRPRRLLVGSSMTATPPVNACGSDLLRCFFALLDEHAIRYCVLHFV